MSDRLTELNPIQRAIELYYHRFEMALNRNFIIYPRLLNSLDIEV